MHFAAFIRVEESVAQPGKYYRNNFCNTMNLLEAMARHRVRRFIFSSTAAVYGEPQYVPVDEHHPREPINPYGSSKRMVEDALVYYAGAHGLESVPLRYFNAAGADPKGLLGPRHNPLTHLIPLVLRAAAGITPNVKVFGRDYPTPDGTAVRDYIHVVDLCEAHLSAIEYLMHGGETRAFNLGVGRGFSVQEVIDSAKRVTGREFDVITEGRRAGDPAQLIANPALANQVFNWRARYTDLDTIVARNSKRWNENRARRRCELPPASVPTITASFSTEKHTRNKTNDCADARCVDDRLKGPVLNISLRTLQYLTGAFLDG
jgi:UDP-glucose 4-epimerase